MDQLWSLLKSAAGSSSSSTSSQPDDGFTNASSDDGILIPTDRDEKEEIIHAPTPTPTRTSTPIPVINQNDVVVKVVKEDSKVVIAKDSSNSLLERSIARIQEFLTSWPKFKTPHVLLISNIEQISEIEEMHQTTQTAFDHLLRKNNEDKSLQVLLSDPILDAETIEQLKDYRMSLKESINVATDVYYRLLMLLRRKRRIIFQFLYHVMQNLRVGDQLWLRALTFRSVFYSVRIEGITYSPDGKTMEISVMSRNAHIKPILCETIVPQDLSKVLFLPDIRKTTNILEAAFADSQLSFLGYFPANIVKSSK